MPSDQRVGFDDCKSIPPIEKTRESGQRKANGVRGAAWFHFSLDIKAELFPQEEIFGCNSRGGPETEMDEPEGIQENPEQRPNNVQKQSHNSILLSH